MHFLRPVGNLQVPGRGGTKVVTIYSIFVVVYKNSYSVQKGNFHLIKMISSD